MTSENTLAINWYYRPLHYFRPAKMTTLNDKRLVEMSRGPSELQMTSSPQTSYDSSYDYKRPLTSIQIMAGSIKIQDRVHYIQRLVVPASIFV